MKLTLTRFAATPDGTFGRMGPFYTLEEEDQGNALNISSIPPGTYVCRRSYYYAGGYETFEVTGVPSRSRILFHVGNTEEDTAGCILLGCELGVLEVEDEDSGERRPKLAVLQSRAAFRLFMDVLDHLDEFELTIADYEDT